MDNIAPWIITGIAISSALLINIARQPQLKCPDCGTVLPKWRKTRNLKQVLWGGWTCLSCRVELDRPGRKVVT
jgi:hypothetical protein